MRNKNSIYKSVCKINIIFNRYDIIKFSLTKVASVKMNIIECAMKKITIIETYL